MDEYHDIWHFRREAKWRLENATEIAGCNWENTRCVLLYTFPVSDEPHHVSIEVIRDALLGIR